VALVDDTYNANPDSVRAAIDVLAELPGPRLLALGDMGEVGDQGLAFHDEVLHHALASGIEHVLVTGNWMSQACAALPADARLRCFTDFDALAAEALALAPQMGSVLVKGSRFMRMERLVQALRESSEQEGGRHAA
jgi:UDP-N-acetylmuramoyl-tripeptide--D-alanyl-D-alanine ligase